MPQVTTSSHETKEKSITFQQKIKCFNVEIQSLLTFENVEIWVVQGEMSSQEGQLLVTMWLEF